MLRASSPTGGALGPVSDTENKLLQSAFGSVEQSTTAEDLEFNLKRLKAIYNLTVHGSPEPPPYISEYAKEAEASQASQYNDMSLEQLEAREAELLKQLGQ